MKPRYINLVVAQLRAEVEAGSRSTGSIPARREMPSSVVLRMAWRGTMNTAGLGR